MTIMKIYAMLIIPLIISFNCHSECDISDIQFKGGVKGITIAGAENILNDLYQHSIIKKTTVQITAKESKSLKKAIINCTNKMTYKRIKP